MSAQLVAAGRDPAHISAQGVGIEFLFDRQRRLVSPTLARVRARRTGTSSWGLRAIDLEIGPGEAVALVGRSGGGKTTLLRTIAGVFAPGRGDDPRRRPHRRAALRRGGRDEPAHRPRECASPRRAGRALVAGRPTCDAEREAASGLGDSFDRPVSSYSQGMRARLGFATADEANPTILLLDEVHEALDHEYRALVQERAREILAAGGIVVAAGHDHPLLEQLSSRALWLEQGQDHRGRAVRCRPGRLPGGSGRARVIAPSPGSIRAMATASGSGTIPWDWYVDPAVARLEQERIFRRTWQYVGHTGDLTEPGSFVSTRAGDVPVVLVRGRDDALRAFVNVCRHRGYLLCDGAGRRETLQCPYHAWTYDLDGSLRTAPRGDSEPGFDRDALGLVPVAVDTWGPFVFVNPDPTAGSLAEHLGDLPRLVAEGGVDVDALVFHQRAEGEYEANWKVCVENYLECYHCAVAHPSFSKAIDVAPGRVHPRGAPHVLEPVRAARRTAAAASTTPTGEVDRGQFHLLFPGTTINVMPGRGNFSIGPVVPLGAERTYRWLDYFFLPDTDEQWIAEYLELDNQVGAEDRVLVERVQVGMRSGLIARAR